MLNLFTSFDIAQWVTALGYVGLILIVLFETGCFLGFFLPGDSLVFAAGLLSAQGVFEIWIIIPALIVTATVGYAVGYWFGSSLGHYLLKRPDSIWFKKSYIERARAFYARHGGKALIFGRLIPVIRTFVPIVAGMAHMPYRIYCIFNLLGAILWGGLITFMGYLIGSSIPHAGDYVFPIALLIVSLSVLPSVFTLFKKRKRK